MEAREGEKVAMAKKSVEEYAGTRLETRCPFEDGGVQNLHEHEK